MDETQLQETIKKLGVASDERLAQILGIAALLSCMPETAKINVEDVQKVIQRMTHGQQGLEQLHRMAAQIAITVVNNAKLGPDAPPPEGGTQGGAPGGPAGGAAPGTTPEGNA